MFLQERSAGLHILPGAEQGEEDRLGQAFENHLYKGTERIGPRGGRGDEDDPVDPIVFQQGTKDLRSGLLETVGHHVWEYVHGVLSLGGGGNDLGQSFPGLLCEMG